jgi:Domain of unknown function (DUF4157)
MSQQRLIGSPENTNQRIAHRGFRSDSFRLFHGEIHSPVLQLQGTLGNRRVAQLIQAKRLTPQGEIIGLQRKLTVGAAVDPYDPEAVRPADPGVRKTDNTPISARGSANNEGNGRIQRKPDWPLANSAAGGEEEIVQQQSLMMSHLVQRQVKKDEAILTKRGAERSPSLTFSVESSLAPLKGGGRPLSPAERHLFEPRVGCDLNGASFQADRRAGKLAQAIQDRALTDGRDFFFAQSEYLSGRAEGRQLLAPKLTHAIQGGQSVFRVQRQPSADATCNGQAYDPKKMCCRNGKLVPQSPIKDLEDCPDRKQLVGRPNEYDGCSVPWFIRIGEDKDNPAGGTDTAFSDTSIHGIRPQAFVPTLPCDVHDKCYQTCNPDPVARELCDMKLIVEASRVCNNSTEDEQVKERCRKAVEKANYILVRQGLGEGAFEERQQQYCHCCPPPADKEKKLRMIANTENALLVKDPLHWDEEAFILRRLPKGTPVEFLHDGAGEKFNNTDTRYQWWFVRLDGVEGWVMQVLFDKATESP